MKLLVSACLLGVACRYDGASKGLSEDVLRALMARHTLVPVCPEPLKTHRDFFYTIIILLVY